MKGFEPRAHFDLYELTYLDCFAQFALVSAREAVAAAGLRFDGALAGRTAVIHGAGGGSQEAIDQSYLGLYGRGDPRFHPLSVPRLMANAGAAAAFKIHGPAFSPPCPRARPRPMPSSPRCCCCAAASSMWRSPSARKPA